jgi:hypothetical protein
MRPFHSWLGVLPHTDDHYDVARLCVPKIRFGIDAGSGRRTLLARNVSLLHVRKFPVLLCREFYCNRLNSLVE